MAVVEVGEGVGGRVGGVGRRLGGVAVRGARGGQAMERVEPAGRVRVVVGVVGAAVLVVVPCDVRGEGGGGWAGGGVRLRSVDFCCFDPCHFSFVFFFELGVVSFSLFNNQRRILPARPLVLNQHRDLPARTLFPARQRILPTRRPRHMTDMTRTAFFCSLHLERVLPTRRLRRVVHIIRPPIHTEETFDVLRQRRRERWARQAGDAAVGTGDGGLEGGNPGGDRVEVLPHVGEVCAEGRVVEGGGVGKFHMGNGWGRRAEGRIEVAEA